MEIKRLIVKVLMVFGFIGLFNSLVYGEDFSKWSPRVQYNYENGGDNTYSLGLDFKHNNKLLGVSYERDTNQMDFILSMNGMLYRNNLDSDKFNYGVGVEVGGRKGFFMLENGYISPKIGVIYNKDLMLEVKYRQDNFIYSVGYSF